MNKKTFTTFEKAKISLRTIKKFTGVKMRVYFCNFCDNYHLTSSPDDYDDSN